jgi:hypothetical protein
MFPRYLLFDDLPFEYCNIERYQNENKEKVIIDGRNLEILSNFNYTGRQPISQDQIYQQIIAITTI